MWRSFLVLTALGAMFGLVTCATNPPPGEHEAVTAQLATSAPRVHGPRGPLSLAETRAILQRLERQGGGTDVLSRHLAIEEAVAGTPLVAGNRVTLLEDGPATYRAMLAAVEGARKHVNLEFFIFDDRGIGAEFGQLLLQKRRQGIEVNLMYDSVGSLESSRAFFRRLEAGGIRVVEVHPLNPLRSDGKWSPNQRDHRKILIVDGRVGFTGGINIDDVYEGADDAHWRDTQVKLEGPVIAELQKLFLTQWKKHRGPDLPDADFFPTLDRAGDEIVRIIATSPEDDTGIAFYAALLSAIRSAERSVWVTQAYFAPPEDLEAALMGAARRGIDVELILPSKSDQAKVVYAGRSHYSALLEAGVKIYERSEVKLHSKTIVIDGVWSVVGSANLDSRSVRFNDEVNAIVLGRQFGQVMEAAFERDRKQSQPVDPAEWADRSVFVRLKEWLARLLEYWI
jgi:cardiolipin synthase